MNSLGYRRLSDVDIKTAAVNFLDFRMLEMGFLGQIGNFFGPIEFAGKIETVESLPLKDIRPFFSFQRNTINISNSSNYYSNIHKTILKYIIFTRKSFFVSIYKKPMEILYF